MFMCMLLICGVCAVVTLRVSVEACRLLNSLYLKRGTLFQRFFVYLETVFQQERGEGNPEDFKSENGVGRLGVGKSGVFSSFLF